MLKIELIENMMEKMCDLKIERSVKINLRL